MGGEICTFILPPMGTNTISIMKQLKKILLKVEELQSNVYESLSLQKNEFINWVIVVINFLDKF